MKRFGDLHISSKLTLLMSGAALASLLAGFSVIALMDARAYRSDLEAKVALLARMYAEHGVGDLAFNYAGEARQTLEKLALVEEVNHAEIYSRDGRLFASYLRPAAGVAPPPATIAERASRPPAPGTLSKCELMEYRGVTYGTLCLEASAAKVSGAVAAKARAMWLLALALALLSLPASMLAQRLLSAPILKLAYLARQVADNKNYSLRSGLRRGDEIGTLAGGFDAMLAGLEASNRERDAAEAALKKSGMLLEAKVEERTAELKLANEELEAFTYSASHDLRAPIRRIDGFSALLEQECDSMPPVFRDYLARIRKGCSQMTGVVDNLLTLSRVLRQDVKRERVDLSALAREAAEHLAGDEPGRTVEFTLAEGLAAAGDEGLLREVVENLLANAWKFTSKTAVAEVEFGVLEQGGARVYFVKDNGRGFDMKYAPRLFRPFKRLHSPNEFPGTGVGLSTVRRIVERHGGRIWAESAEDQGATFYFTLQP